MILVNSCGLIPERFLLPHVGDIAFPRRPAWPSASAPPRGALKAASRCQSSALFPARSEGTSAASSGAREVKNQQMGVRISWKTYPTPQGQFTNGNPKAARISSGPSPGRCLVWLHLIEVDIPNVSTGRTCNLFGQRAFLLSGSLHPSQEAMT